MEEKQKLRTLVIGVSLKQDRPANLAVRQLKQYGHPVVALGLRNGFVDDVPVLTGYPLLDNIHTVTLYLNPQRQKPYYEYIIRLKPKRVIFNPGTENHVFASLLQDAGIAVVKGCTLVLLATGNYARINT
ncbi:MAG: CoA-binding protein [Chitinophagales bacterium]|nr:CoA-binding protein [Chitinophagales bacterium]MDW8427445.1 CoA-binding protein [Chitinophagales bacterium]